MRVVVLDGWEDTLGYDNSLSLPSPFGCRVLVLGIPNLLYIRPLHCRCKNCSQKCVSLMAPSPPPTLSTPAPHDFKEESVGIACMDKRCAAGQSVTLLQSALWYDKNIMRCAQAQWDSYRQFPRYDKGHNYHLRELIPAGGNSALNVVPDL